MDMLDLSRVSKGCHTIHCSATSGGLHHLISHRAPGILDLHPTPRTVVSQIDHGTLCQAGPRHVLVIPLFPKAGCSMNPLPGTVKGCLEAPLMFTQPVTGCAPGWFLDSAKEEVHRK